MRPLAASKPITTHRKYGSRFTSRLSFTRDETMMLKLILGVAIGGGLGFAYCKFVGCSTGTCPLTSNPWISSIYGAILGLFIAGSFR